MNPTWLVCTGKGQLNRWTYEGDTSCNKPTCRCWSSKRSWSIVRAWIKLVHCRNDAERWEGQWPGRIYYWRLEGWLNFQGAKTIIKISLQTRVSCAFFAPSFLVNVLLMSFCGVVGSTIFAFTVCVVIILWMSYVKTACCHFLMLFSSLFARFQEERDYMWDVWMKFTLFPFALSFYIWIWVLEINC